MLLLFLVRLHQLGALRSGLFKPALVQTEFTLKFLNVLFPFAEHVRGTGHINERPEVDYGLLGADCDEEMRLFG